MVIFVMHTIMKNNKINSILEHISAFFLGYLHGQKGYKVYDLERQKLFVSRDVIFHEHNFPFQSNDQPPITSSLTSTPTPINQNVHISPDNVPIHKD